MDRLPGFRDGLHRTSTATSRVTSASASSSLADAIKADERYKHVVQETLTETLPVGVLAFVAAVGDDPYDFDTPFGYHSSEIFEYAMRSLSKKLAAMGMEPSAAGWPLERRDRDREPARARPRRPPSDAPQRILDAAYEVLTRDGYAGLTHGEGRRIVGSEQGVDLDALRLQGGARRRGRATDPSGSPRRCSVASPSRAPPRELVEGLAAGVWRAMDREEGLQRVYFDLASQSVVEPRVGEIMREMKEGSGRSCGSCCAVSIRRRRLATSTRSSSI